jgi:hypothetical protein
MAKGETDDNTWEFIPIGSMYGIYANVWGILMVNVTIYSIHGSYGIGWFPKFVDRLLVKQSMPVFFLSG